MSGILNNATATSQVGGNTGGGTYGNIGGTIMGIASIIQSLDSLFGTGRKNYKLAKQTLDFQKQAYHDNVARYNEEKAQARADAEAVDDTAENFKGFNYGY